MWEIINRYHKYLINSIAVQLSNCWFLFHFQSVCFLWAILSIFKYYFKKNGYKNVYWSVPFKKTNWSSYLLKVIKVIKNCLFGQVGWVSFLTWIYMQLKLPYNWISSKGRVFIKGHLYAIMFSFRFKSPAVCNVMHRPISVAVVLI